MMRRSRTAHFGVVDFEGGEELFRVLFHFEAAAR
jgi:uncharacterized protein YrzB (UPF0473 family)